MMVTLLNSNEYTNINDIFTKVSVLYDFLFNNKNRTDIIYILAQTIQPNECVYYICDNPVSLNQLITVDNIEIFVSNGEKIIKIPISTIALGKNSILKVFECVDQECIDINTILNFTTKCFKEEISIIDTREIFLPPYLFKKCKLITFNPTTIKQYNEAFSEGKIEKVYHTIFNKKNTIVFVVDMTYHMNDVKRNIYVFDNFKDAKEYIQGVAEQKDYIYIKLYCVSKKNYCLLDQSFVDGLNNANNDSYQIQKYENNPIDENIVKNIIMYNTRIFIFKKDKKNEENINENS